MADVIDVILERLSASCLQSLDELSLNWERESRCHGEELEKSLDAIESVYLNRRALEVNNKAELLIWKTKKQKNLLDELRGQFKKLQIPGVGDSNPKKMKAYNQELNRLEERLNDLTKDYEDLELEEIFIKTHDMHKKIEDFEMKISEVKKSLLYYENFPASFTEGQRCVDEIKTRIKEKEAILERKFALMEKEEGHVLKG